MNGPAPDPAGEDDPPPFDRSGARALVGYRSGLPDDGRATCTLDIGPEHLNRLGLLHGGFVAMLLDNCTGLAVRTAAGDRGASAVTASLTVNYISGARAGRVIATGRVTGGGRTLKFAEAELRDEEGRLLATATGTFRMLGKR